MKAYQLFVSTILLTLVNVASVSAATFDFISYADSDADADGHNERGYKDFGVTEDGITLHATGYYKQKNKWANSNSYAYLDRGNAGLGVCHQVKGLNQCDPSSDDNVTHKEKLVLTFDQTVSLDEMSFRNGGHGTKFKGKFQLSILLNGIWGKWSKYDLDRSFTSSLLGEGFAFYNPNKRDKHKYQFYIDTMTVSSTPSTLAVSAVPAPSSVLLLMLGLIGLRANKKMA